MDSWLIVGNNIDKKNKKLNIGFKNKIVSILIDRSVIENELTDLYNCKIEKRIKLIVFGQYLLRFNFKNYY